MLYVTQINGIKKAAPKATSARILRLLNKKQLVIFEVDSLADLQKTRESIQDTADRHSSK